VRVQLYLVTLLQPDLCGILLPSPIQTKLPWKGTTLYQVQVNEEASIFFQKAIIYVGHYYWTVVERSLKIVNYGCMYLCNCICYGLKTMHSLILGIMHMLRSPQQRDRLSERDRLAICHFLFGGEGWWVHSTVKLRSTKIDGTMYICACIIFQRIPSINILGMN
jgi:hypothetical protein